MKDTYLLWKSKAKLARIFSNDRSIQPIIIDLESLNKSLKNSWILIQSLDLQNSLQIYIFIQNLRYIQTKGGSSPATASKNEEKFAPKRADTFSDRASNLSL